MNTNKFAVLMAACLATSGVLAEGNSLSIGAVKADPSPAKAGQEVKITVSAEGEGSQYCGLVIHFDDGSESRQVKVDGVETKFPLTIAKTYAKPGTYSIKAEGIKITNHGPCAGVAKANLVVEPGAKAGSPCPDGYKLAGKVGKAGDYSCKAGKGAKKPEKIAECPGKLEYFQTSTSLGCRKAK